MSQQPSPILGVIARGGAGPISDSSTVTVTDPSRPTWANDLFRSHGSATSAIIFVPDLERHPQIGQGTQLDELLPEHSPHVAVVGLPTHVTGIQAAIRDCAPLLGRRAEFIAAVRAHVSVSYAGAWLKRVAKLETPSPSFGQHMASWWPFSNGHFVTLHPTVAVRRTLQASPPDAGTTRVVRTSGAPSERLRSVLQATYGAQHGEVIMSAHRLATRWGTDHAVEYVVTPAVAPLQLPPPVGSCPTCGDPVWGQCAFCHTTPPQLEHWMSVEVPGVPGVAATLQDPSGSESSAAPTAAVPVHTQVRPEPSATSSAISSSAPKQRAFQLPRRRKQPTPEPRHAPRDASTTDD